MATVYKGTGLKMAKLPGVQGALDVAAARVMARAKANIAGHTDTGHYAASLHVQTVPGRSGVKDRLVVAGDPAAIAIEYGHFARDGKTYVAGLHPLGKAIR